VAAYSVVMRGAAGSSHRLALLTSSRARQVVPAVLAGGYSVYLENRKPPKLVSEIVADRTATSSTWRDADGSITVRQYAAPHFYKPAGSSGWVAPRRPGCALASRP
jgi:hypothetical protein